MDYPAFVRLRSPLWEELESRLAALEAGGHPPRHADLEAMALAYRQVLHDHALAATRFKDTSAARRLARLAAQGTRLLHRERSHGPFSLLRFLTRTFPQTMRRQRGALGVAALLFVATTLLGFALALAVPSFAVAFIGAEKLADLEQGKLWTDDITAAIPPSLMSSLIATNNVSVALSAWAGGVIAGIGSPWVLVVNGLMLGSILAVSLHFGVAERLLTFIAAHGPLELSIIVVAAAGGLVLARGLIAAEDRPRAEVLRAAVRDAFVMLAGSLPWLAVLGVVEGYVSTDSSLPVLLKALVGVSLFTLFVMAAGNPLAARKEETP